MNSITTTLLNTTMDPLDILFSYFVNPLTVIRFYQIGYTFIFLFGFIGNTASLLTFSQSTLRKVSTGCLFITLAVFDTAYLLMCVFDYLEFGFSVPFYHRINYNVLCRFRSFIMYTSQFASAWILVTISVDRWIRTRFPFKSKSLCTPKKVLLVVIGILVFDVGLHSHMLTPMFGRLLPGFANGACGPIITNTGYLKFYYYVWSIIQIFTTCVVPAFLMLIIIVDIFIQVRFHRRVITHANQANIQKQMFILTLASVSVFFCTNLPVGVSITVLSRGYDVMQQTLNHTKVVTILGWLRSWNYAMNFYIYCLTSSLFRNEFKKRMNFFFAQTTRTTTIIHNSIAPAQIKTRIQPTLPQLQ